MGLRVNKVAGYGLAGLEVRGGNVVDGRINLNSPLLKGPEPNLGDFVAFARKRHASRPDEDHFSSELALALADRDGDHPRRCTTLHSDEGADTAVLILRPLGATDWHRSDDIIDYLGTDDMETSVRPLPGGIHPYEGRWMDRESGHVLRYGAVEIFRDFLREDADQERGAEQAQKYGFGSMEDVRTNLAPAIPEPIVELAEFGELFTSPRAMRDMRPMTVTFWR